MADEPRDEPASPRFRRWLVCILLVAAALRLALLVYAERDPARFDFPDTHRYVQVARNIAAGLGPIDSSSIRAGTDPLYPALLSIGISFGMEDTAAILRFARIVNVLGALGTIALLALLGRRLIGSAAGLIAAGLLALDPILLFFNGLVLTETLFIAIFLASLYCIVRQQDAPHIGWSLAAGLMIGLGIVTRSTSLLLPVMLFPFVVAFANGARETSHGLADARPCHPAAGRRAVALFVVGAIIPLLPVVVRNYRLFHHVVPVRTGSGASLLEAFGPWADGGPGMNRILYPSVPADADEYARDRDYRKAALRWIRENPGEAIRLAGVKLRRTWSVTLNAPGYVSSGYRLVGWLTVAPIYLLACLGAFVMRKRAILVLFLIAPAIYFSFVHMVFVGSVRYRLPAMPFVFLLAGAAIDHWRNAGRRQRAVRG
jgi:dolichyl-phosphate-mannose-protein mannosyltransferase